MGVLTKINKKAEVEKPKAPSAKAAVCLGGAGGNVSAAPDHACPDCTGGRWWFDSYGAWHCEACRPPRIEAAVRRRHSFGPVHNYQPDGIEAREDLGALFGAPFQMDTPAGVDWVGGWWREFLTTDGIRGWCRVGGEREAVRESRADREAGWI